MQATAFYITLFWLSMLIAALHPTQLRAYECSTITLVSNSSHFGMVHHIEAALFSHPHTYPKLIHITADSLRYASFLNPFIDTCLIVTIGSQALDTVLKTDTALPILSVLLRKNTFNSLLNFYNREIDDPKHPISVIYLDQPLKRQLQLVKKLMPDIKQHNLGILLGPESQNEKKALQNIATQAHITPTMILVNKFENPVAVFDTLLDETNIVIAIPDSQVYNSKTARGILLTAFHKRVPLIGYSHTFVNNGAIAAVYSTTKQMAQQTATQIITIIKNKKLPPPQYPQEYAIAVNYQVARSLGMAIDSEAALKNAMEKMDTI